MKATRLPFPAQWLARTLRDVTAPDEFALPPELPLLALRSTIVFPHGTIAVQMGAADNLALLRAHAEPGVLVALAVALGDAAPDPARHAGGPTARPPPPPRRPPAPPAGGSPAPPPAPWGAAAQDPARLEGRIGVL